MPEPNYQRIAESLVENSKNSSQEQSLDHQTVFDSVENLCESPEGGQFFAEATANIDQQTTKNKLIASLNWVNDSITAIAVSEDTKVEMVKPFQLAAIGLTAAIIIWIFQNPPISRIELNYL